MKRFFFVSCILFAAACIHGPEYSLPDPPQLATVAGQGCAIKCREADYDCKMACQGTIGEQLECVSQCNQELDRCYKLCMEILE
jgi:hypothetical protein